MHARLARTAAAGSMTRRMKEGHRYMKKIFTILLTLAMLISLAACGAGSANSEIYEAISCVTEGVAMDCRGDWVELKGKGKGTLYLRGSESNCSWTLDGETFTLKSNNDEFNGTLRNGVITLDYNTMQYVFVLIPIEDAAGNVRSHSHVWKDADCENGKSCADCGIVEGVALGHVKTEANYQDPSLCSRCGIVLGDPLQPDMVKYGIKEFVDVGVVYSYTTSTQNNSQKSTTGELQILSYEVFESAKGYPAKKGYQWHVVEVQVDFFDNNAKSLGASVGYCHENYYDINLSDATCSYDKETGMYSRMINYHGEEMPIYYKETDSWSGWQNVDGRNQKTYSLTRAWLIPTGYDGCVMGFYNHYAVQWANKHIYEVYNPEHFLLFRLK